MGMKLLVDGGAGGGIRLAKLKTHRQSKEEVNAAGCKRTWKAGEELVVSYGPTPQADEEVAGVDFDIRATGGTPPPPPQPLLQRQRVRREGRCVPGLLLTLRENPNC